MNTRVTSPVSKLAIQHEGDVPLSISPRQERVGLQLCAPYTRRKGSLYYSRDDMTKSEPSFHNTDGQRVWCRKNLPSPNLTCTVLIPGFGVARPAFETCM